MDDLRTVGDGGARVLALLRVARIAAMLVLLFLAVLGVSQAFGDHTSASAGAPSSIALALPLLLAPVVVAAAYWGGQLLAVRLVGMRVMRFGWGPLLVERGGSDGAVRWNAFDGWRWEGVRAVPRSDGPALCRASAAALVGGPLAALLLAHVAGGAYFWRSYWALAPADARGAPVTALAWVLAALALGVVVVAGVPNGDMFRPNTAMRAALLLLGDPASERRCVLDALYGAWVLEGRRPRDWEPALVERALELRAGPLDFDAAAQLYAYYWFLDTGDMAGAGVFADKLLARRSAYAYGIPSSALHEGAYFLARHRGDAATARQLLRQAAYRTVPPAVHLRAEAAVLLAEGERAAARTRAEEGLRMARAARRSPEAEEEWLHDLLRLAGADASEGAERYPVATRDIHAPAGLEHRG